MKRFLVLFFTIVLCFLLQTSVFQWFKLAGVMPNILIILVVSFALMRGRMEGLIIGFACGLLSDIMYSNIIGVSAILYMTLGYLNGYFNKLFYAEDIILPLTLIISNDLIYNLMIYGIFFFLRNRLDFLYYARHIILPEMVYTTLVTLIIYKILLSVNSRLEESEKRSVI